MNDAPLLKLLHDSFGLTSFRLGQREIIRDVLQGHDTLAVMPTGGGKSLCYQLPALTQPGITLVISPLISLMRDQVQALQNKGIPAGCIHSNQTPDEKRAVFADLKAAASFLLYVSPERVQHDGFGRWIKTAAISRIAIDEAHCISKWGVDFREDYYRLGVLREWCPGVPVLALTATATPQVLDDISKQLRLTKPRRHVYGFYRPNLYYQVEACDTDPEKLSFLTQALTQTPAGRVIIYAGTRKNCENLVETLSAQFSQVEFYHAGMNAAERTRVQGQFEKGETRILIATNAFGMGVDLPDVRLVAHYQLPPNIESYYQEVGRAGRDGKNSTCLLLHAKKDKGLQSYFIRESQATADVIARKWESLETMVQYVEGGECRHGGVLTYFKDTQRITECGHCDVCDQASPRKILRPAYSPPRIGKSKTRRKVPLDHTPLSNAAQLRYEHLRVWRHEYALARDIAAFVVLSNKALEDLVRKDPGTLSALGEVHGIGPQKLEQFGAELLQKLAECR